LYVPEGSIRGEALFTILVDNRFVAKSVVDRPTVSDTTASCDSNVTFGRITPFRTQSAQRGKDAEGIRLLRLWRLPHLLIYAHTRREGILNEKRCKKVVDAVVDVNGPE